MVSEEAVVSDGRDQLVNEDLRRLSAISCPVTLVRAGRNLMNEPTPLFSDASVAESAAAIPQLVDISAPTFNHYSLMLTDDGADVVTDAVLTARGA